jgi:8-oxo-dGTP pyrophosphatase MutT (NUDIX family)
MVSGFLSDPATAEPSAAPIPGASAPLGPNLLRSRLARGAPPAVTGDEGHALGHMAGGRIPAAVLIGIVEREAGPQILLTQRAAHLRDHAGQISLPGGRIEAGDAGAVAAALREAEEEIGLDAARVEILGELPVYDTVTGFRIHPVVGWVRPPPAFTLDPFEVAELFEVPLGFTLDPRRHERHSHERDGQRRHFWVLRWHERYIWGATAGILVNFARQVAG